MNFAQYMLSLNEQESNKDEFGELKLDKPETEGLGAAQDAAEQFSDASDGQDTDVDLAIDEEFPKDTSGFDEEADVSTMNTFSGPVEEPVDPETIPADAKEADQFSEPDDIEVKAEVPAVEDDSENMVSDAELATDDDLVSESFTGWDDLF